MTVTHTRFQYSGEDRVDHQSTNVYIKVRFDMKKYNNESQDEFFTFIIGIIHRKILTYCKCNKTNYFSNEK